MKRTSILILTLLLFLTSSAHANDTGSQEFQIDSSINSYKPQSDFTLWYTFPATSANVSNKWMEYSLPIGNGQLGASIMGGVLRDEIQFNEKTLWSGSNNIGENYGHYQNFGSLYADFLDEKPEIADYYRALNLDSAICSVGFCNKKDNIRHTRQYFVSFPDKCIIAHYKASGKGGLNLRFSLESGKAGVDAATIYRNGEGFFAGKLDVISYGARFKVCVPKGKGTVTTTSDGITVRNAEEITVILTGATDFDPYKENYVSATNLLGNNVKNTVDKAAAKGYKKLLKRHLSDYMPLFSRMSLKLDGAKNDVPTNVLVDEYGEGKHAKTLQQLYFAYGRYLAISSSRGIDLPSNLQGIWSNYSNPPWNSDIHSNINVQMNYWPVEATNLSELHLPFLNYITNMATNHREWKDVARAAGQTRGWTIYTENNNMGGMGAFAHNYVIANAWYATHLWQHYRYTLDKDFLKRALPTMWSATEFWLERLVRAKDGTYECPNEYSPEQGPDENATAHSQQLVYELFDNTKKAANVVGKECGISKDSLAILDEILGKLDRGLAIETYDGKWGTDRIDSGTEILREWKYSPYSVGAHNHRHASHLMCLYPFSQITQSSPYFRAAVNSMKLRGDFSTGWSMGWKINLWARALNGNRALQVLSTALRHSTSYGVDASCGGVYYNLYDSHAPFQIDGNFGACSGIAEMLMQSHTDTIQILPALPDAWNAGSVKGMKAIGNFTVDFSWKNGNIEFISIVSCKGTPLYVNGRGIGLAKVTVNGKRATCKQMSVNTLFVPSKQGDKIVISF